MSEYIKSIPAKIAADIKKCWGNPLLSIPVGAQKGAFVAVGALGLNALTSTQILINDPEQMQYFSEILSGLSMTFGVDLINYSIAGATAGIMFASPVMAEKKIYTLGG